MVPAKVDSVVLFTSHSSISLSNTPSISSIFLNFPVSLMSAMHAYTPVSTKHTNSTFMAEFMKEFRLNVEY